MRTEYVIYDERAVLEGTDEACVLEASGSLREVKTSPFNGRDAVDGAVFAYDVPDAPKGETSTATNERFVGMVSYIQGRK